MDEGLLTTLLRIPGVGKRRARTLVEKFPTLESLRNATVGEIDALPNISLVLARRLKEFAEAQVPVSEPHPPILEVEPPPPDDVEESTVPPVPPDIEPVAPDAEEDPKFPSVPTPDRDWLRDFVAIAELVDDSLLAPAPLPEEEGPSAGAEPKAEPGATPHSEVTVPSEPATASPEQVRREAESHSLSLCPKCGALFGAGESLCTRCGEALVDALDSSAEPSIPEPTAPPASVAAATGISDVGRTGGSGIPQGFGRHTTIGPATGRVNGLAGATPGRVNGLAARNGPGQGMVNGLVNGNGLTNGNTRAQTRSSGGLHSRRRSVVGIAAVVLLLLVVPLVGILLYTPPPGGIAIDGLFGDWESVPLYEDSAGDSGVGLDLATFRVKAVDDQVLVYARIGGNLWNIPGGEAESVYAFVDEDGDSATGFQVSGIGAERVAEFYGWDGGFAGNQVWEYDPATGVASDDWRSLRQAGSLLAASAQDQIEARILAGGTYDLERARILFHTWSNSGRGDAADAVVGSSTGALSVSQRTVAAGVIQGSEEPFLAFSVRPLAASLHVASVTIRQYGSFAANGVTGSLFLDGTGDGRIDAAEPLISTSSFSPDGTFAINRTLSARESYVLRADFTASMPQSSIGFRVVGVSMAGAQVPVTITETKITMAYLEGAPANVTVDGAFADWDRYAPRGDADDDVQSVSKAPEINENVDIRAHEAIVGENVSVYLRVDGRLLGGVDIPNVRGRFEPPRAFDSDGDTVPDDVETVFGQVLPGDFNNDNISDADQFEDVDQDGVLDYNKCHVQNCDAYADYYLETTLPSWYPAGYGGKLVRRYIGPVSLPPMRGIDTALMYVDRDNRTDTGLLVHVDGVAFGMDYVYQAIGRGGVILVAGLYRHDPTRLVPWERVADVATRLDTQRLEAAFDATLIDLTPTYTFVFTATDWQSNADSGQVGIGLRGTEHPVTRSSTSPQAFDIPGNQKLYLRNANHTTETACTTNKVTSATPGPGPASSISLRAGQSACWYADGTAGTFIPAGDWETLLDLFLSHGIAVYGEGSVTTPRYRESDGRTFGTEGSANGAASTINWVVVASSPLNPEKVVGALSSNDVLYIQTWNGASWTSSWNTNLAAHATRKFDIAYEEKSGDVVVAFGDGTAQLKYRKRVNGTWDGTNGNAGAPLSDDPYWVRLTPDPTTNDLMGAVSTNADTLSALRWDGTTNAWANQVLMPGIVASKDQEAFDVVYERSSGDAFVIWGNDVNQLRYREFTSAWGATTTAYSLPDKSIWVTAAADPEATSNRIAVGMVLNNDNLEFGAWTGAGWVVRPTPVAARNRMQRGIDVGFEATTNRAMFVFNPSSNGQQIAWRTWTQTGGWGGVNVESGSTGNVNFVQLRPDPRSNAMMLLISDNNGDLWHRRWNGTAWSPLSTALEVDLSERSQREAFMFAWTRVVEYDVYLEIWDKATNAIVDTIGSCLDSTTYGDDVQCLVPGVAGKFLGPNEVVRVRIVLSSPGGAVGILFNAPAPAGDSRATIPSFLAVPEFETFAIPLSLIIVGFGLRRKIRNRRGKARNLVSSA